MLTNLRIENFAIIEDIEIDFKDGMNCLLGETGAGKSIIIEALSLLKGTRSSFNALRDESKKAIIEGTFVFKDTSKLDEDLLTYLEDDTLIVSRVLLPSKQSVVRINGETASLNVLNKLMKNILDIHSQGDNYLLFNENKHIEFLDRYIKDEKFISLKKELELKYKELKSKEREIEEFKQDNDLNEEDYLRFQIEEIDKYALKENEIEELNEELESLNKYSDLKDNFSDFKDFYYGNKGISVDSYLSELKKELRGLKNTPLENEALEADDVIETLNDKLNDIFFKYDKIDYSPERIDEINSRLYDLSSLRRKFGRTTSEILAKYDEFKSKLDKITNFEDNLRALNEDKENLIKECKSISTEISDIRRSKSLDLEKDMNNLLEDLGLLKGGFKVSIEENELTNLGTDKVIFLVSLNKGMKYVALKEAASGGENSRLMLALKRVFNDLDPVDTLVFDEIDTGISGNVAFKVAKVIKEISKSSEVIVISHSPQVVAASDNFFLVYKTSELEKTASHIKLLKSSEAIDEVAKMISNEGIDSTSRKASEALFHSFH